MSEFTCRVVNVRIEPHPNADAIEIARVGDFQSIVKKGQFQDGDLGVYIPEQAVLPEWLLKEMGFWDEFKGRGTLSGSSGNRVKAIKLRGVLSQGIMLSGAKVWGGKELVVGGPTVQHPDGVTWYRKVSYFKGGEDVAEFLGVVKYEPPVPSHMMGRIIGVDFAATHKYDFENLKATPDLFKEGEDVVITEKIHGTFMGVGVMPKHLMNEKYFEGRVVLFSKGLGAKGFLLDHNDTTNLYAQAAAKHDLLRKVLRSYTYFADKFGKPLFVFGEVFGKTPSGAGVQDLTYTGEELGYRAFDICMGNRGTEKYLPWSVLRMESIELGVDLVPLLYSGPFSKEVVLKLTNGETWLDNGQKQIREGVVIKSAWEDAHPQYGRKIAKSISEAYLLRKGNATEFN